MTEIETVSDERMEAVIHTQRANARILRERGSAMPGYHPSWADHMETVADVLAALSRRSLDAADGRKVKVFADAILVNSKTGNSEIDLNFNSGLVAALKSIEPLLASRTPNTETVVKAEPVAWPGRQFCETAERNTAELAKFIKGEDDLQVVTDAGLAIRTLLASIDEAKTDNADRTDAEIFVWLEAQAKESRTGISFDWVPPCEGEPSGWRFMRHHFISEPHKSIRQATISAMDFNLGRAFK